MLKVQKPSVYTKPAQLTRPGETRLKHEESEVGEGFQTAVDQLVLQRKLELPNQRQNF